MTILRVDLALTTGLNDGTSWANAYQGKAGLVAALAAAAAGDTVYWRGTESSSVSMTLAGLNTIAAATNPVRIIGVRTDAGDTIAKTDVILGFREGDSAKAYTQTGAEIPPNPIATGGGDFVIKGCFYCYAGVFEAQDNTDIANTDVLHVQEYEECSFTTGAASGDTFRIGAPNDPQIIKTDFKNCLFTIGASVFQFSGSLIADFYNCEFTSTRVGTFTAASFTGIVRFIDCDFTGCNATLVDISNFFGGRVEFWNCRMPSGYILTTGTATGFYTVANYGSEANTGLTTGGSEQELKIHTHLGEIDIETTVVRTGGATDLAAGLFAYGVVANNVTDNFVGVEVPLADIWVEGDGTAKTYTVFIANSLTEAAANLFEDDEVYLRLSFPSAAGISMYDHLPDEGAPGDGGGRTQLLGTPVDLSTDGSTWGTGGNNKQKLSQSIAPDYEGPVHGTLIYSRSGADTLYVDSQPTVA